LGAALLLAADSTQRVAAAAMRIVRGGIILKRIFQGMLIITINFWHCKSRLPVDELNNNKFHHKASEYRH
jgi:hypothetical protein